jgi:hypothetical protein
MAGSEQLALRHMTLDHEAPTDPDTWGNVASWRKVLYGLGAVVIGSALAGIPTSLTFALVSSADETVARAVSGVVALIFLVAASLLVFRWMRDDYEYVHSAEYARRNPDYVQHNG